MLINKQTKKKKKKKKNLPSCGFFGPTEQHRENKKERNKYLEIARELKMLGIMKVIVKPIVFSADGTVPKGLEKRDWRLRNQ